MIILVKVQLIQILVLMDNNTFNVQLLPCKQKRGVWQAGVHAMLYSQVYSFYLILIFLIYGVLQAGFRILRSWIEFFG